MATRTFPYESKSSGDTHTVTVHEDGRIECSCKGFVNHGKCWHHDEVKERVALEQEPRP